MGLCSPSIPDAEGRISIYASSVRPTSGDDFYIGKVIFEYDTNKIMLCTSIAGGGTWSELAEGDGWTSYSILYGAQYMAGWGGAITSYGASIVTGFYRTTGAFVEYFTTLAVGAGATFGASSMYFNNPFDFVEDTAGGKTYAIVMGGGGFFRDNSTGSRYPLRLLPRAGTPTTYGCVLVYNGAAAGNACLVDQTTTGTFPVVPATSDVYAVYGRGFTA